MNKEELARQETEFDRKTQEFNDRVPRIIIGDASAQNYTETIAKKQKKAAELKDIDELIEQVQQIRKKSQGEHNKKLNADNIIQCDISPEIANQEVPASGEDSSDSSYSKGKWCCCVIT